MGHFSDAFRYISNLTWYDLTILFKLSTHPWDFLNPRRRDIYISYPIIIIVKGLFLIYPDQRSAGSGISLPLRGGAISDLIRRIRPLKRARLFSTLPGNIFVSLCVCTVSCSRCSSLQGHLVSQWLVFTCLLACNQLCVQIRQGNSTSNEMWIVYVS